MFFGKRTFRFLNRENSPHNECIKNFIRDGDFIVQVSSSKGRFYVRFSSCDSFYSWYKDIPEDDKTFSEVIMESPQKFRVDIDEKMDNIYLVRNKILNILVKCGLDEPKIMVYDIKTSYHMVLCNFSFPSNIHCEEIARILSKDVNLDLSVYKKVQHFRIEGCTKLGERRWKRRITGNLNINNFHEGIISDLRETELVSVRISTKIYKSIQSSSILKIPPCFKIRSKNGSLTALDRLYPSYCYQCYRIHDNENAYMVGNNFFCWRKVVENKYL